MQHFLRVFATTLWLFTPLWAIAQENPLHPPARPDPVRVCSGGDVTLGNNLYPGWDIPRVEEDGTPITARTLLRPMTPLLKDADVVLVNVESAIGSGRAQSKCGPRSSHCFAFRSPPEAAAALAELGKRLVVGNVANNHAMDAGPDGYQATLAHLKQAGVLVTGDDTVATLTFPPSKGTVAILGFSTSRGPDPRDLDLVARIVRRASYQSQRVVVTMHMGAEGVKAQRTPDRTERFLGLDRGNMVAFAHAAVDAGADLVIGHGPHVMRAMEWRGNALIAYSLGNLITHGPFSFAEPLNRGAILCADLDSHGNVLGAHLRPTFQVKPGFAQPDFTAKAIHLVNQLGPLDFPKTYAWVAPDGTVHRLR